MHYLKIKEQICTTVKPLLRYNIEIQQIMAQDNENKKELYDHETQITSF